MHIREHLNAENPAVVLYPSGVTVSFAELEIQANRLAHYFRQAGLREGDAIAVIMENNAHIHAVMWAARRIGLYYVLVNTHLTAAEAAYIIKDSGATALFASSAMRELASDAVALLDATCPTVRLLADEDAGGWVRYPDCVAGLPGTPIGDEIEGDLLQYSSGTTGRPKGIRRELPHVTPAESPVQLQPMMSLLGVTRESIYLNPAPLYHTAPAYWSMSVQALGATTVVMERFTPDGALDAISRHGITHGQFVPAMFVRMLKLPPAERLSYDTSSLQRVLHAAAPCPQDIKRQMIDWWGPIVDEFYSSSEGSGISFIRAEDWLTHPGSVGKPVLGVPHILDDNGAELPPGQPGVLYFENAMPFEYLGDPAKTAAARNERNWSTVGDIGYLDEDGYLYLTDRRHHMIISGGVNIYPQEAEDALISHPKVLDAAVFGIPDEEMGQSVKAVVQLVAPSERSPTRPRPSFSPGSGNASPITSARDQSPSRPSCRALTRESCSNKRWSTSTPTRVGRSDPVLRSPIHPPKPGRATHDQERNAPAQPGVRDPGHRRQNQRCPRRPAMRRRAHDSHRPESRHRTGTRSCTRRRKPHGQAIRARYRRRDPRHQGWRRHPFRRLDPTGTQGSQTTAGKRLTPHVTTHIWQGESKLGTPHHSGAPQPSSAEALAA